VLLLDEPTGAVDVEGTEIVENALREYTEKNGCTLITATHSPLQAKRLSERVIMLQDGRIAEDCTPEEFFLAPKTDFGKKFVSMWSY
jgi:ABC-type sulfate/molybdate transport systems ATPase subunit